MMPNPEQYQQLHADLLDTEKRYMERDLDARHWYEQAQEARAEVGRLRADLADAQRELDAVKLALQSPEFSPSGHIATTWKDEPAGGGDPTGDKP